MKTILRRRPGFFTVTNGFVSDLGPEWPDGAEVSLKRPRTAVVFGRTSAIVADGGRFDEALADAEAAILGKRAKVAMVGRAVGRLGDSILYECGADLCAEGSEATTVLPAPNRYAGDKELKTVHMRLEKAAQGRRVQGLASTPNIDRDYDVVLPTAFNESLPGFMANNPMMLMNHHSDMPVGKIIDFQVRPEGLWVTGEIASGTQCADECWALIQQGVLRTFSVQFIIIDRELVQEEAAKPDDEYDDGTTVDPGGMMPGGPDKYTPTIRKITKAELIEVSIVSIPCNREATFSVAKSLRAGSDVVCAVCRLTDCECAEAAAVVEYRSMPAAMPAQAVARGRDAIVKALGRDADRLACLVQRPGAAQFKHHGVIDGELVLDPLALRCAMASLVAYTDQGGDPLTEAERRAAHHHLARHFRDLGLEPPALGKGPRAEGVAEALVGVEAVFTFAKDDGYERQDAAEKWLIAHAVRGAVRDGGTEWVVGVHGRQEDRNGVYQLDKGVQAVVYRPHASKQEAEKMTTKSDQADQTTPTALAVPPATPAVPAATPPAAPVAAQAPAKEPEGERTVEIELDDLNALRLAAAGGGPGLTHESLEHAFSNVEIEST